MQTEEAVAEKVFAFPLSFSQQRLWLINQLEPGSAVYNIPTAVRLKGKVDTMALELAVNEVVRRHESLRTIFPLVNGQPAQVVTASTPFQLSLTDLRRHPAGEREAMAQSIVSADAQRPFDLARGPLRRLGLLWIADDDYVFHMTMHHMVSDGWSRGVLITEVAALYECFAQGKPSPLPELPIQYADYAVWQREQLQGDALAKQLDFWKQLLAGAPQVFELPADKPRPPLQSFRGAVHSHILPADLAHEVQRLSVREGATLFMTLFAAFGILLSRYTGQEDILVGSPIANRDRPELEGLIGYFANTLIFRADLTGRPSFRELLRRVRKTALSVYEHQDFPFERLVEELHPERDVSRNPLFQVLFTLHNNPRRAFDLNELSLSPFDITEAVGRGFDLALDVAPTAESYVCQFEYSTELFEEETIVRLAGHFQTLLEAVVADPQRSVATLPLLCETERQLILHQWNETREKYAEKRCLHEVFEAQAEATPDAPALVFEDERLTYRELNARANQLAHRLQAKGVLPDTLVGVCLERSAEMMVALLGILKAGGAYVPLDPTHPTERLRQILDGAALKILVTAGEPASRLTQDGLCVINLDDERHALADQSRGNPESGATKNNLAYVVHTSGSTGIPKGVAITHHSIVHLARTARPLFSFTESDVWTVFHTYSFDLSYWEMWVPLLSGACIVVVPKNVTQSPPLLYELLVNECVTVLSLTPSVLRQLFDPATKRSSMDQALSLRFITCGGEALPSELANELIQQGVPVWNFYGPTEATVWASVYEVSAPHENEKIVPVGRPLPDVEFYLLEKNLEPVPIGVPGEINIGGIGLARGYLGRPDLTAERFIPHPFSAEAGARLYRTGDVGRYKADGTVEFLGRIDQQVKVRGFRIELEEIESQLGKHPQLHGCAVETWGEADGKRLVAYVVARENTEAPPAVELRSYLKQTLPEYMIPATFVVLDELPLNANGKLNRRALPHPQGLERRPETAYVAPQSQLEQLIADAWKEVLKVEQVGIHDNFFDLGGHSMLMVQVSNKLREALRQEIPMIRLFQYPNVHALATFLTQETAPTFQHAQNRADTRRNLMERHRQSRQNQRKETRTQHG